LCIFTYNSSPFLPELFLPVFGNYPFLIEFLFLPIYRKIPKEFSDFPFSIIPYPSPHLLYSGPQAYIRASYTFPRIIMAQAIDLAFREALPHGSPEPSGSLIFCRMAIMWRLGLLWERRTRLNCHLLVSCEYQSSL